MKRLLLLTFFVLISSFNASLVSGQEESKDFSLSGKFIYDFQETGEVKVREEITIKNATTEKYIPVLTFNTSGFHPQDVSAFESGLASKVTKKSENEYEITLKRPALGQDTQKTVAITFTDSTLAKKRGETWEILLPQIENRQMFEQVTTVVRMPEHLSQKLHIYPHVDPVIKKGVAEYTFDQESTKGHAITAYIGNLAVYDFTIHYPLKNPSAFGKHITFAIPPDTAFQKVYLPSLPKEIELLTHDSDGNWIASTYVAGHSEKTISLSGSVFVFADENPEFPKPNQDVLLLNTKAQQFWEIEHTKLQEIASTLPDIESIYEYVASTLTYDYQKTTRPQARMGAAEALAKTNEAICMEFTDLFIALARAKGIPAREMNGFAFARESNQPRGLGSDILHSWPEYWDETRRVWIPVDPTWGHTTGGVNYFSQFDLRHIAFVIHGISSTTPQTPGTYKSDIQNPLIEIKESEQTALPAAHPLQLSIKSGFSPFSLPTTIEIYNPSGFARYATDLTIQGSVDPHASIVSVLPYATHKVTRNIPAGFMGMSAPATFSVALSQSGQKLEVPLGKWKVVLAQIMVFLGMIAVIGAIAFLYQKYAKNKLSR